MNRDVAEDIAKLLGTWCTLAYGWLTLQHIATALAAIYSALQIYLLVRDRIARKANDAQH